MTLQEARTRAGLTITGAAIKMRLAEATILDWERNGRVPRPQTREKICKAYNVKPEDISWPGAGSQTALEAAMADQSFVRYQITNFACPADFDKKYKNFCGGDYPDASKCRQCWRQKEAGQ